MGRAKRIKWEGQRGSSVQVYAFLYLDSLRAVAKSFAEGHKESVLSFLSSSNPTLLDKISIHDSFHVVNLYLNCLLHPLKDTFSFLITIIFLKRERNLSRIHILTIHTESLLGALANCYVPKFRSVSDILLFLLLLS
jgi:hypothetical protein